MVAHVARDLSGPGQAAAIRDLLQAIFISELVLPSKPLWITSGWISDIEFLDNTARAFGCLQPDWPAAPIRLSSVIEAIVLRGGEVRLIVRQVDHNDSFLDRLAGVRRRYGHAAEWRTDPSFHAKGLLGDDFLLEGSMNFTRSGLLVNDERVTYRTDRAGIAQRRVELEERWERLPPC
jgi:phosphatidylserine/phosphatidylglycerophosphate/cardiolipin synthase-like enzyme